MTDLNLPLRREYFEQIRDGEKTEEYRLHNEYWRKRLYEDSDQGNRKEFDRIVLTLGYPSRDDHERRLIRPWRGFTVKTITHPHFGPDPVQVYAIDVRES